MGSKVSTYVYFLLSICFLNLAFAASVTPTKAPHSMVVSTQHLATKIGLNTLKKGGNAIDAAVAIGYALAVVEPCCGNLGGGGFMLIHLRNGKNHFIDFREMAPFDSSAKLQRVQQIDKLQKGYLAVGVPGTVMGLNYAVKHYGTLPLKTLIQPAIQLAADGFTLSAGDVNLLKKATGAFLKEPNVAKIFLNDNKPYAVGDVLKQTNLSHALKSIQQKGSKGFYKSWIAKAIVSASNAHGGALSLKDFALYRVFEREPIQCSYRGYNIISAPPPSSGGITLCQMLTILEAYPLDEFGFHSAKSVHLMSEAMRFAYANRNQYLGDPDFVKIPTKELLSKQLAQSIRKKIIPNQAYDSNKIGFIKSHSNEKMQTTSYAVVDKFGNAVEVTYTLNGYFGAKIIAKNTGFFLNNEMDDFTLKPGQPNFFGLVQSNKNRIEPHKRPLSSMTPTIITKNGKVILVTGAAGGSTIITQVLTTIINVLDFKMNIQSAIDAGRFHMQWLPDKIFMEPLALNLETQKSLEAMGYTLQQGSPYGTKRWGASVAIFRDKDNFLYGAVDSRRPVGLAAGN